MLCCVAAVAAAAGASDCSSCLILVQSINDSSMLLSCWSSLELECRCQLTATLTEVYWQYSKLLYDLCDTNK
jgi:hypothetical protein